MNSDELIENAKRIRQRLRYPPNAVYDPGIDLTRKSTAYKGDIPPPDTPKKKVLEVPPEPPKHPPIIFPYKFADIMSAVSRHYGIAPKVLCGITRFAPEVLARKVIVHLSFQLLNRSLKSIGRELNKDHTTILHAKRRILEDFRKNPKLQDEVLAIEESIRARYRDTSAVPAIGECSLAQQPGESPQEQGIHGLDRPILWPLDAAEGHQCVKIDQRSLYPMDHAEPA